MCNYTWRKLFVCFTLFAGISLLAGCDKSDGPQEQLPTVTYMKLTPAHVTLTTELPGRASAFTMAEVRPQVSGIIVNRLFTEGADVKAGDVLYQIDPALYQASYDSAKATLMKAEANSVAARLLAERYRQLVRLNAVSKQEADNAEAAYGQARAEIAAAKAALDTARINLEYTKVTSPTSGRIGSSFITPGALVTQNQPTPLATVQQLDPMYVDVTQSSMEHLRLRKALEQGIITSRGAGAMGATLKLEDGTSFAVRTLQKDPKTGETVKDAAGNDVYTEESVIGELKFSDVTVEQSTGAITIRAVFPNPDGMLLPGMYVRAVIEEGVNESAILIPQRAVFHDNRNRPIAQVLIPVPFTEEELNQAKESGKQPEQIYTIETRVLTIDRTVDNQYLVGDGLKPDELMVLEGRSKVRSPQVKAVLDGAPSTEQQPDSATKE